MRIATLGLVDVLAAGAGGAERVDLQVGVVDLDLDRVVHHRIHPDAGEAGLPAGGGVERADAHQAVHAGLGLQPAIGVRAGDLQRRRFDARPARPRSPPSAAPCSRAARPSAIYMRSSISAQSCASVPPAPALTSRIGVVGVGLAGQQALDLAALGLRRRCAASAGHRRRRPSPRRPRPRPCSISSIVSATSRLQRRQRPRSGWRAGCARASSSARPSASFQSVGSSARAFSSARRAVATSQSKMPPQQRDRLLDLLVEGVGFGGHGGQLAPDEAG